MSPSSPDAEPRDSWELARERDLQKYYLPWLDSNSLNNNQSHDSTQQPPSQRPSLLPSHDATLTALAQLAALRLNSKRAMVSLIKEDTQIVLAEATQTISLVDQSKHDEGDQVWLGQVSLPRKDLIDEYVFDATYSIADCDGTEKSFPALIVADTAQDDRFKDRTFVVSPSNTRFYAGVPIVTNEGHHIGVFAVSDPQPRPEGLTVDQVQFMQDLAQIITSHLERLKTSVEAERDEVFVKGMHTFIQGVSAFKHELDQPVFRASRAPSRTRRDVQATDPQTPKAESRKQSVDEPEALGNHSTAHPMNRTFSTGEISIEKLPKYSIELDAPSKVSTDTSSDNVKQIYQRAAVCIREALEAQGCVFLDASSGIFSSFAEEAHSPPARRERTNHQHDDFDDVDQDRTYADELDKMADVLGSDLSNVNSPSFDARLIKKRHLKTFITRHSFGQIFHINNRQVQPLQHPVPESDGLTSRNNSPRRPSQRPHLPQPRLSTPLPQQLLDQLPQSTTLLLFLPLFNYAQNQWSSGVFIWSNSSKNSDVDAALPYLKTFMSCVVSEVNSMESFNTNKAKSTFIASISHDLRSPLHGLLGSLEFLEDTMTSAYQSSLLGSIETCGKTLLDTIDHLLDFAKINNLNQPILDRKRDSSVDPRAPAVDSSTFEVSKFDFGLLLEEVVEAVFAGQTFRKTKLREHDPVDQATDKIQSIGDDDSQSTEEMIHGGSAKFSGKVFFILDIRKARSYSMKGQTGGLRRVIMNVVGNAIKYCSKGCIEIVLDMERKDDSNAEVFINVRDTGIGMSRAYLENHLFKAFSQEDSFAPGAGLGLSIASQIVQNMHGKIRVQSEKNVGTHVSISLPMKTLKPTGGDHEELLKAANRVTSGKKICLLNPYVEGSHVPIDQLSKLTASIARTCEQWFDMECYQSQKIDDGSDTAIYVYCEPPPIEYLIQHHSERRANGKSGKEAALLIICANAFEAAALRAAGISQLTNLGRIVEVISQPVGARKLAKVLLQSFQRIEASVPDDFIQPSETTRHLFGSTEAQQRASEIQWQTSSVLYDHKQGRHRPSITEHRWKSERPFSSDGLSTRLKEENKEPELGDIKRGLLPGLGSELPMLTDKAKPASESISVLLVDDNAINLKLLVTFVKKIKLPYAEAENGLDALNLFKNADKPFDFVLMDLQMPVMDGLESTRKIREFEKEMNLSTHATIIAITGVGNDSVRKEAMDAGMTQYLTKPVKFKALQQLLEKHQKSVS